MRVRASAPGRVNLIGEHVDYTGGRCLPMAVDLGVVVEAELGGSVVRLTSDREAGDARVDLAEPPGDPTAVEPPWARLVAAVAAEVDRPRGLVGAVTSTVPVGAGMSSSAALGVAVALALGADPTDPVDLAQRVRRAEEAATGVPCGILDQLASAGCEPGAAMLLDCRSLERTSVPVPEGVAVHVVHSGRSRTLAGSGYAERRRQCEAVEARIGPLRDATPSDLTALDDPLLVRRARHVVTENARVLAAVDALRAGDLPTLGAILDEGHASLRDDFEVSTSEVEATVARLRRRPGVHGVRLMGGGFGGCVVAVGEPGAIEEGWAVRPGPGARVDVDA